MFFEDTAIPVGRLYVSASANHQLVSEARTGRVIATYHCSESTLQVAEPERRFDLVVLGDNILEAILVTDPMLLPSGNPFKCHEEVLFLQHMIPPTWYQVNVLTFSPLTGRCSEGLGAFRFFFKAVVKYVGGFWPIGVFFAGYRSFFFVPSRQTQTKARL